MWRLIALSKRFSLPPLFGTCIKHWIIQGMSHHVIFFELHFLANSKCTNLEIVDFCLQYPGYVIFVYGPV